MVHLSYLGMEYMTALLEYLNERAKPGKKLQENTIDKDELLDATV